MEKRALKNNIKVISIVILMAMLVVFIFMYFTGKNNSFDKNSDVKTNEVNEKVDEPERKEYEVNVLLTGGSGKAKLKSPTKAVELDGKITVILEWSSPNYDYMIVNEEKYLPINTEGNSTFEIPFDTIDNSVTVIADTVAMSKPHEIEYMISFERVDVSNPSESSTDKSIADTGLQNEEMQVWISNHTLTSKIERKYAEKFGISYYDDKYCILCINNNDFYLLTDTDNIPDDLPESIQIIHIPIDKVYVVSTASMDYFLSLNALDQVSFTSFKKEDVENDKLLKYMDSEKITYAGKYSAPDYEKLLSQQCSLVVENTMITHSENVLDKFHELKINTLVDYSSYENTPYGRMEWIKLYGILTGHEEEAEKIFSEKESSLSGTYENTGKTVAYFYITDSGNVVIRKNQDYIVKLMEIAGGKYIFSDNEEYNGTGTMTVQKETFFESVLDCDYLVYNSTISGKLQSTDELLEKFSSLKNTKAYKNGNIYCTQKNIYLSVMELPEIAKDINGVFTGKDVNRFLYKLN